MTDIFTTAWCKACRAFTAHYDLRGDLECDCGHVTPKSEAEVL